jgi:anti-anti-sigma regulatory factor
MTLKIEKASDGPATVLRLSGRIESAQVQELKAQIDGRTRRLVLDLEQVRLVDLDAVHFLAVCEAEGVELRRCPQYVRQWILSETPRIRELER